MAKRIDLPENIVGPKTAEQRVAALIKRESASRPLVPWDEIRATVEAAHRGRLLPAHVKSPEQAIIIAAKGYELGLPPMQALANIYVINGTPALAANLMLGLAYKHLPAFDYTVVRWTHDECALRGRRSPQHSWVDVSYTTEDARAAGLPGKTNWKQHPRAMLFARASGMLCRAIAPDTFAGIYTIEEASSMKPTDLGELSVVEPVEVEGYDASMESATPPTDDRAVMRQGMLDDLKRAAATGPEVVQQARALGYAGRTLADLSDQELSHLYGAVWPKEGTTNAESE